MDSEITQAQRDELARLADAATPGPWRAEPFGPVAWCVRDAEDNLAVASHLNERDAAFIAAACNAAKPLLSALTRTEQERDAAVALAEKRFRALNEAYEEGIEITKSMHETGEPAEVVADLLHLVLFEDMTRDEAIAAYAATAQGDAGGGE